MREALLSLNLRRGRSEANLTESLRFSGSSSYVHPYLSSSLFTMDNPKSPYDPNVNQPQNTDQPKRSGSQETWPAKGQGSEQDGMKSPAQTGMPTQAEKTGIPPSTDQVQGHGQSAPNLLGHGSAGRDPQKVEDTQTDGDAQVGRRGGLDRNQDLNKENHEGEIPKSDPAQGEEPPFESRMPGEPPRDGENTTPDEN